MLMIYIRGEVFQSTHSQGVRPGRFESKNIEVGISIHALTRSATIKMLLMALGANKISIHALTRSATNNRT